MIEIDMVLQLVQYGIAGLALYMMYSITYNHLIDIGATLHRIETLLEKIGK